MIEFGRFPIADDREIRLWNEFYCENGLLTLFLKRILHALFTALQRKGLTLHEFFITTHDLTLNLLTLGILAESLSIGQMWEVSAPQEPSFKVARNGLRMGNRQRLDRYRAG
jgi:hypothetical protein